MPFPDLASQPFRLRIVLTIAALTALFTALAPEASYPLNAVLRLAYWFLHIGIGLVLALIAAAFLMRSKIMPRDWRLVLLAGILAIVVFAPIALALEHWFPVVDLDDDPSNAMIGWRQWLAALALEALELSPSFLAAWLLVNMESLRQRDPSQPETNTTRSPANTAPLNTAIEIETRLPAAIRDTIISATSDLHYLNVVTKKGKAMILGALADVETAYGDAGLRIHRSHWVLKSAVTAVRRGRDGLEVTVNGGRFPVARRRAARVRDTFGTDFNRESHSK